MPNYRRVFIPGGTWFFTVNLLERRTKLLTANITTLRHVIFWAKRRLPFRIDALVILPDHMHAIITLPPDDADYPTRIRLIKTRFSKSLPKTERLSAVREKKGERGVWQRRYWEHYIRDKRDLRNHIAYCYFNPVKHNLVTSPRDWRHSTYHRDVLSGRFDADWQFSDAFDAGTLHDKIFHHITRTCLPSLLTARKCTGFVGKTFSFTSLTI